MHSPIDVFVDKARSYTHFDESTQFATMKSVQIMLEMSFSFDPQVGIESTLNA